MKKLCLVLSFIFVFALSAAATQETLIILDQSASMYEPLQYGMKFKYAKRAVYKILENMDDNEYIGLRTIGINPEKMRLNSVVTTQTLCHATERLNDINPHNRANIKANIPNIIPSGMSPIQYVLQTALKNDFHASTDIKHIILVTDGYENCNGDPCNYIRKQMLRRKDLIIDIVAIGVNSKDAHLLQCLTDATHGKFINVKTPDELTPSVNNIFNNPHPTPISPKLTEPVINTPKPKQEIMYKNYLLEFNE